MPVKLATLPTASLRRNAPPKPHATACHCPQCQGELRDRDDWGHSAALREKGQEPSRWYWVYRGTVFRLDHRGQTARHRPLISQRGYVATRRGIEALMRQLYGEALARGLGQTQHVLVLADGAVWIWNALADRFPHAQLGSAALN